MQNPINYIADNPDNIFEKAKDFVGEKISGALDSSVAKTVGNVAEPVTKPALSLLGKAAVPYREHVAPALSAVLLELNNDYRAQNQNLSIAEQLSHGFDLAKQEVPGKDSWRRNVSPGRAFVGLLGSWNFAGESGTEKINWADAAEVDKYFSSGSAQFWSGVADAGFNILDPVAIGGNKIIKPIRKSLITREAGSKFGQIESLVQEVDQVVANPEANTAASHLFKLVEKDPENLAAIQQYGVVAGSNNPARFAVALSDAQKVGGRELMGDVLKASLGHIPTIEKLKAQHESLMSLIEENTGRNIVQEVELKNLKDFTKKGAKTEYTPKQVEQFLANAEKTQKAIDAINEENKLAAQRAGAIKPVVTEEFGVNQTWSRFGYIEKFRAALAEAQSAGVFPKNNGGVHLELDPENQLSHVKSVAKQLNIKTPVARTMAWISPNQQLRERQSGMAFLGGTAGERSYLEADSRIAESGRVLNMGMDEMKSLSNEYRRLTSKSERFLFFENLQQRQFQLMIEKHYTSKLGELTDVQKEAFDTLVRTIVEDTNRAKQRELKNLMTKKYTVTDMQGNLHGQQYLDETVEELAAIRAEELGKSSVSEADRQYVKRTLEFNQLTETQVPNMHFAVDIKFFDNILSENPQLLNNMVDSIMNEGWDAGHVRSVMTSARKNELTEAERITASEGIKLLSKTAVDVATDGLDQFYTYVWKPFTLLSFKYTSRNIFEGYLRVMASMVDFNTWNDYGWSEMFKGLRDPGATARTLGNFKARRAIKNTDSEFNVNLRKLKEEEGILGKQLATMTTANQKLVNSVKKTMIDDANRELFKDNDGISMTVLFMQKQLKYVEKHKSNGVKSTQKTVDILNKELAPLLAGESGGYASSVGESVIKLIGQGEYRKAFQVMKASNAEEMMYTLNTFKEQAESVLAKLNKADAGGAETVSHVLENSKFALERLVLHTEKSIILLKSRGEIQGELSKLGAAASPQGVIKKSFEGKIEVYPGVFVDQSLGGDAGEMIRMSTSSRASATRVLADDRRVTGQGLMSIGQARRPVGIYEPLWAQAHSDYVNNILMKDRLAKRMIESMAEGHSAGQALIDGMKWLGNNKDLEVAAWKREIKGNMSGFQQSLGSQFSWHHQAKITMANILRNIPGESSTPGVAYENLYRRAVDGFTPEDSAKISIDDRIEVIAQKNLSEMGTLTMYKNLVSSLFHAIGTLPEDHLVRHPFFNMVHDAEINKSIRRYEKYAKQNNLSVDETTALINNNINRIKTGATNRAYKELMQRLYSVERHTSPSKLLRWVAPFYMAHQNSSRFWLGQSLRNPSTAYSLAKVYNAPFRSGFVQDDQGNIVSEGTPWDKNANQQKIVMATPQLLRKMGIRDTLTTSPSGVDVITQGQLPVIPTLGGFVGETIGQEGIKLASKNAGVDTFLQKHLGMNVDDFSQKYVLPFYTKGYGKGVAATARDAAIPLNSWVLSALAATYGTTGHMPVVGNIVTGALDLAPEIKARWEVRWNSARDEVVAKKLMNNDPLDWDVINEEASKLAAKSLMFESASSLGPTVVAFKTEDSTMRQMSARLKQLQSDKTLGYSGGTVRMATELEEKGYTYGAGIVSTLRSSAVDNKYGLVANLSTIRGVQANTDSFGRAANLYPDNPFIGELFNQNIGTDKYSPVADELMYSTLINGNALKNRNLSPQEADYQAQMSAAWATYWKNADYIDAEAEKNGIKPGSKEYKFYSDWKNRVGVKVGEEFPVFATRNIQINLQKSDKYIELATFFLNDKKFMSTVGKNNDAIAGLKLYMENRQTLVDALEQNRKATGTQGLDTKDNRWINEWKGRVADAIIERNPGFKQIYDRYLSQDELNPIDSPLVKGIK